MKPAPSRWSIRLYSAVAIAAIAWAGVSIWAVPLLIRLSYAERALPFLNDLIAGRDVHPVSHYLGLWRSLALRWTALLVLLAVAAAVVVRYHVEIRGAARTLFSRVDPLRNRDIALLAVLFGIMGGLAEATQRNISHWVFHRTTDLWVSSEIFWMAPLALSIALLAVAVVIMAVRRWTRVGRELDGIAPFVFAGLAVFSLGRAAQVGIHPLALFILAIGVGTQVTRSVGARTAGFLKWTRRGTAVLVTGLVLWGALLPSWPKRLSRSEGMAGTAAAAAAAGDAPNILVVLWDTVRARSLSLYGYGRPTTPNLDALAEDAVVFDAAITTAPWTLPAHASLFTGRYHHELSVGRQFPLDNTFPTLAEVLGERGYRTGGFVANSHWLRRAFGLSRGFQHYEDRPHLSAEAILLSTWFSGVLQVQAMKLLGIPIRGVRITAEQVNQSLVQWIDQDDDRPFFAFLNLYDAHEPYLPPSGFGFQFSEETPRYEWDYRRPIVHSASDLAELTDAYDSCLFYLDHQLGLLIDELEARGLLENTVVLVTADHGETLGDHWPDLLGHENNMFYDVLEVPLVLRLPSGSGGGKRVRESVSIVDVPATLLELAGVQGSEGPFAGHSLAPLLLGQPDDAVPVPLSPTLSQGNPATYHLPEYTSWPISKGPLFSLIEGRYHYIVNAQGEEQLFDPTADPWERLDLSGTAEGLAALPGFRAALAATVRDR